MTSIAVPGAGFGPAGPSAHAPSQARTRWRIDVEARALMLVSAVLLAFGLATLYSASAFKSEEIGKSSAYFLVKQLSGVGIGTIIFAVAAKVDAELWRKYAWHLMVCAMIGMLLTVLPFTRHRAADSWRAPVPFWRIGAAVRVCQARRRDLDIDARGEEG